MRQLAWQWWRRRSGAVVSGGASCCQWHWLNTFSVIWLVVSGVSGDEDRMQKLIMDLAIMMTCKIAPYTLYEDIFHVIVIVISITLLHTATNCAMLSYLVPYVSSRYQVIPGGPMVSLDGGWGDAAWTPCSLGSRSPPP